MSDDLAASAAGIDYSSGRPGGAAIRAAGFTFAMRYLGPPDDPRCITPEERGDLHANGVAIGLVWETQAARALSGFQGGALDALSALDWMVVLQAPEHVAVYMTADFDTNPANVGLVSEYVQGAASVLGFERTGIYGEFEVIDFVWRAGACRYLWQCRAWSGTPVRLHPARHLYQPFPGGTVNGALVDYDAAYGPDQGLWLPPQEEDMADPRVDKLIAALTGIRGEAALDEWNANGNDLLAGYAAEQAKLADHIENHRIGVGGPPIAPHTHVAGGVAP